jgi:hypothetical protein
MRRNEQSMPARRGRDTELASWDPGGLLSPSVLFSTSPWQLMRRIQEDLDGLFGQFAGGQGGASQGQAGQTDTSRVTGQAETREPALAGAKGGEASSRETTGQKQP